MILAALSWSATAAERAFDFSQTKVNETPQGFRSTVSGEGKPGEWKVILDDAPSALPALSPRSPVVSKQSALAQLSRDATDEHFPLLIFEEEEFGDFVFTARVKAVAGEAEQMAGLAFRIQDAKNYYVVRISALGNNVRFYKFVNGIRSIPIGPEIEVPKGQWHELSVECRGNRIHVRLNGQQVMPALNDTSFLSGKVGFWTKSDSVSYFTDARITFTRRLSLAESLVSETIEKYSKLQGLKLYAIPSGKDTPEIIGSSDPADIGQAGGEAEQRCIREGLPFFGKGKEHVTVMMPLRDRNGDIVGAVKLKMDTFWGQTENNAVGRARPVLKFMESRLIASTESLR